MYKCTLQIFQCTSFLSVLFIGRLLVLQNKLFVSDISTQSSENMRKVVKKDSWARIFGKTFIAAEVISFAGCYFLWRKLNRDQVNKK